MSAFTFADHKFGGRFTASVDAIGAGHLNRAAGILAEIADELNQEATAAGLLSEEAQDAAPAPRVLEPQAPQLATSSAPADLQMCVRGVHAYGASDPTSGWRECAICGQQNVAPPENQGAIDMSIRQ